MFKERHKLGTSGLDRERDMYIYRGRERERFEVRGLEKETKRGSDIDY